MPVGVWRHDLAGGVETSHLLFGQVPSNRAEILAELLFISGTDDHVGNRRPLQQPVESNLGNALPRLVGHFVERINDLIEVFVRNRRALVRCAMQSAHFGKRLSAADLSCQAPPAQWTPHDGGHFLVDS